MEQLRPYRSFAKVFWGRIILWQQYRIIFIFKLIYIHLTFIRFWKIFSLDLNRICSNKNLREMDSFSYTFSNIELNISLHKA